MHAELAYLNEAHERVVATEPVERFERMAAEAPSQIINGFKVSANRADFIETKRVERLTQLNQYRADARSLQKDLEKEKIEPLAIITKKAWAALVQRAGLFTVLPERSEVFVSRRPYEQVRVDDSNLIVSIFMGAFLGLSWATLQYFREFAWETASWIVICGVVALLGAGGIALVCGGIAELTRKPRQQKKYEKYVKSHTWEQTLDELTSGRRHLGEWLGSQSVAMSIIFPDPPEEVASVIRRVKNLKTGYALQVAADAGAISFVGGMQEYFGAAERSFLAEAEALRHDPILYVERGTAVAVIAQYGDFPIERKVIDDVLNSEHLL